MTWEPGGNPVPAPCPRGCGGYGEAHKLTCPVLRYVPARIEPNPDQPGYNRGVWEPMEGDVPLTLLEVSDVMNRRLADAAAAGVGVREAVAAWAEGDVPP